MLERFGYRKLGKRDKGVVLRFLVAATGISRQQMERLVRQWRDSGTIRDRRGGNRGRPFARKYAAADIRLLAEVDEAFGQMSGLATREVLRRQFEVFGDARFARLAAISNGHVYNLRNSATYRAKRTAWTRTRPATVAIGPRQAPEPEGRPGHVRVDTVHQGDRDGVKGLYLINLVDEVTQHEFGGAAIGISERFLLPLLEGLLLSFPFAILGFHADNGSEYINHRVAALLDKLRVERFTKSRARHSNDSALVEGKNARVVRRHLGHEHIPARFADDVDALRARASVAVCELPPPRPVRDGARRLQRQGAAQVPARRRQDAVREAEVAVGGGRPPEAGPDVPGARPDRRRAVGSGGRPGAQRGPRRTVPADPLDHRRGVKDREPSGPRFPPPVHRRFHVRGDHVRGQAVENAISLVVQRRRRCSNAAGLPNITSRLRGRPGELNRSLRQGRLVPESSDTRHRPPRLWPKPRFMLTFSLDNARIPHRSRRLANRLVN